MKKTFLVCILFLLLSPLAAEAAKVQFIFEDWDGPPVRVFVSRPVNIESDRPVVFVMHGTRRNAQDYRDQWHELAKQHDFLLVVPEFTRADFQGAEGYNLGNVFDPAGNAQPMARWSFSVIEPLFDEIRRRFGVTSEKYSMYGHSAGAQFVHRFLFHLPEARIEQAVVANAGWYMLPDLKTGYPYGFSGSVIGQRQLERALSTPVTVLLGEEDTDPEDPNLRRAPEALAQGEHRLDRGKTFYSAASNVAGELGVPFNWTLVKVPGADHDNRLMAIPASELLAPFEDIPVAIPEENIRQESKALKVMSFNAWGAGLNHGKPITETVAVLRQADADMIGLQETRAESDNCGAEDCPPGSTSVTAALAEALGYFHYESTQTNEASWGNAILSRYPIGKSTPNGLGVEIDVEGTTVHLFNIHLTDFPYQPYQLLGIEYGDAPFITREKELIEAARSARQSGLELLFEDIRSLPWDAEIVITGDLNEPSHRDWTRRAVASGLHPAAIRFPSVREIEKRRFVDVIRQVYPDEVARPAFTWTPLTEPDDINDHHDRIDYVFVRGRELTIRDAWIVGEKAPEADLVVTPWPSDHRAVLVEFLLQPR